MTMNIYSRPGTKVRFTNENGYDFEREQAAEILNTSTIYTVKQTYVESWSSTVELLEFPKRYFNTVMFEEV